MAALHLLDIKGAVLNLTQAFELSFDIFYFHLYVKM